MTAIAAAFALAAVLTAPPSPVLRSQGERLTAVRGSYCWLTPAGPDGLAQGICSDTGSPVTKRSLPVGRGGRVRVGMRISTDELHASLRGRAGSLRVTRVGGSRRRFVVRLPRRMKRRVVLDLLARYPQGDGSFGARLRIGRPSPPLAGPPRPVLRSQGKRLTAASGSFCWVRLCVDVVPRTTRDSLPVRRHGLMRVDTRTPTDLLAASIQGGATKLRVRRVRNSKHRFVVRLPSDLKRRPVLQLFARYPKGDGYFSARLRVRPPR